MFRKWKLSTNFNVTLMQIMRSPFYFILCFWLAKTKSKGSWFRRRTGHPFIGPDRPLGRLHTRLPENDRTNADDP